MAIAVTRASTSPQSSTVERAGPGWYPHVDGLSRLFVSLGFSTLTVGVSPNLAIFYL